MGSQRVGHDLVTKQQGQHLVHIQRGAMDVKSPQEATHLNGYIPKSIKFRHLFLWHQNMGDV